MSRIAYQQCKIEVDGGVVTAWLRAAGAASCPDVLRIFTGVTLYACRSCGRKCSPDVVRCHCGEKP